jgi:sugar (glycoside-pentoside-hexuronide) transporter
VNENEKKLPFMEKLSWALGQSTGRQFVTALVSTYILVFMTDVFGVPVGAAGVIMTCAAIWDAINDPIIGSLADRTRTKWGTYRPYLLFVPLPLAVVSVLLFAAPNLTTNGKIVYAAVLYICYGMLLTCLEVPYNAILPTMSKNDMEKNDIISLSTFIASIMILIVTSFTMEFVNILGGEDPAKGYMLVVLIGAVLMCITSWIAFANCKERYKVETENVEPVTKSLSKLFKLKKMYPMLLFWCVGCILYQIVMTSSVYYCTYYLMNPGLIATYMLVLSLSGMAGVMLFMPLILRAFKGSMKKSVTVTQAIAVVCYALLFLSGGRNLTVLYVLTAISSLFATMTNAFRVMTVVGFTDYVYEETGAQLNGTISAIGGFSYKCGTAISSAILSAILAVTGYIPAAIGAEPEAVLTGINGARFLVPLVASVLYIIFIQFYPEKKMAE